MPVERATARRPADRLRLRPRRARRGRPDRRPAAPIRPTPSRRGDGPAVAATGPVSAATSARRAAADRSSVSEIWPRKRRVTCHWSSVVQRSPGAPAGRAAATRSTSPPAATRRRTAGPRPRGPRLVGPRAAGGAADRAPRWWRSGGSGPGPRQADAAGLTRSRRPPARPRRSRPAGPPARSGPATPVSGQADVGAEGRGGARGHLHGGRLAHHRTVAHAEQLPLDLAGVGHDRAPEPLARPGHRGQPAADQPAGHRLGHPEGQARARAADADRRLHALVVGAEHGRAEQGPMAASSPVEQLAAASRVAALAVIRTLMPSIPLARKAIVGAVPARASRAAMRPASTLGQRRLGQPPGAQGAADDGRRLTRPGPPGRVSRPARPSPASRGARPARRRCVRSPSRQISPGAVPRTCGMTVGASGHLGLAQVVAGHGRGHRPAKISSMRAATASSSSSGTPRTSAMASRVMSSWVGPSPPQQITASLRARPGGWR